MKIELVKRFAASPGKKDSKGVDQAQTVKEITTKTVIRIAKYLASDMFVNFVLLGYSIRSSAN
jgi:hypothetical protein